MSPPPRIHIVGASSSGTTTLGAALARELDCAHFDTDSYFWVPTEPPFTTRRPADERLRLLEADLDTHPAWTSTGSLMTWGDGLVPRFTLAVFLYVPADVRLARLLARERERYGAQIEPGGRMHQAHTEFVAWASRYDDPTFTSRSLARHRQWLSGLPCPVIEISGAPTLDDSVARVLASL